MNKSEDIKIGIDFLTNGAPMTEKEKQSSFLIGGKYTCFKKNVVKMETNKGTLNVNYESFIEFHESIIGLAKIGRESADE